MISVFKRYISLILNMVLTILKQYHLICVGRLYYSVFLSIIRNNSVLVSSEIILRFFLFNVSWLTPSILYILCHSISSTGCSSDLNCWILRASILSCPVPVSSPFYSMFYSIPFCSIPFSSSVLRLILFQFSSNSSLCLNSLTQPRRLLGTGSCNVFPVPKPPHSAPKTFRHKVFQDLGSA